MVAGIGEKIRRARQSLGLREKDVANRIGISQLLERERDGSLAVYVRRKLKECDEAERSSDMRPLPNPRSERP